MQTTSATPTSPSAGLTLLGQIAAQTSAASSDVGDGADAGDGSDVSSASTTAPPALSTSSSDPLEAVNNRDSNIASESSFVDGGSTTTSAIAAAGTKRPAASSCATLPPTASSPADRMMQRHCRGWRGEKYEELIHLSNYDALAKAHAEKTTMADQYPLTTIYNKWAKYGELEVRKEGSAGTAGSSYVIRSKQCRTELPFSRRTILCTECGSVAKALGDMNAHANREKERQQYCAESSKKRMQSN